MAKKSYYAVVQGQQPGIYATWEGRAGAAEQVRGYPNAVYKGFARLEEAVAWFVAKSDGIKPRLFVSGAPEQAIELAAEARHAQEVEAGQVVIYTDGGSTGNPGPGGYGVVLLHQQTRKELSGGYRLTTNNRMELMACIAGLRALSSQSEVTIFSDSRYVVEAMNEGWARRWRANRWMRGKDPVLNADLWKVLLALDDRHDVAYKWVEGHAGSRENERCDQLARAAASRPDLPADEGYENSKNNQGRLF